MTAGGAVVGSAYIELLPRVSSRFQQETQRQIGQPLEQAASKAATDAGKTAGKKFSVGLGDALAGLGAITVARKVFGFFQSSIATLAEFQKIGAQTAAVIKSTGGVAGVSADHVAELAGSLEDLTTVDDKAIQSGANLLLTFKNVRNEAGAGNDIFDQAVAAATDLSEALPGTDVSGAALQLGKALEDPITGLLALRRSGVSFSVEQRDLIKTLVESGQVMEAQKIILGELTSQFGGSAEALGDTLQGRLNRAADAFEELQKNVGLAITPIVEGLAQVATFAAKIPAPIITVGAAFLGLVAAGVAIVKVRKILGDTTDELRKLIPATGRAATALRGLSIGAGVVGGVIAIGTALNSLITRAEEAERKRAIPKIADALITLGQASEDAVDTSSEVAAIFAGPLGLSASQAERSINALRISFEQNIPGAKEFAQTFDEILAALASEQPDVAAKAYERLSTVLKLTPEQAKDLFDDYAIATHNVANEAKLAAGTQKDLGEETETTADAFKEATKQTDEWRESLEQAFGVNLDLREAQSDFRENIDQVTESLKENGRSFDLTTEKGRANDDALRALIESTFDLVAARADDAAAAGKSFDKNAALEKSIRDLRNRFPGLREQIDLYVGALGKAPKKVETKFVLDFPPDVKIGVEGTTLGGTIKHGGGWIYGGNLVPLFGQSGEFMFSRSSAALSSSVFGSGFLDRWNRAATAADLKKLFEGALSFHQGGTVPAAPSMVSGVGQSNVQINVTQVAEDPEATAFAVAARLGFLAER